MVEEWNFWQNEHNGAVKGGSPLTNYLGIEMAKLTAMEMHSYWHTQKCLVGHPTPEFELAPGLVNKTQRCYYQASTVLKNTVELSRYFRNVRHFHHRIA